MSSKHAHECRRCGADIVCLAGEDRYGACQVWNGDNDGCPECAEHSPDCRDSAGYRCGDCYPAKATRVYPRWRRD